ncbi:MAG: flagellar motor switch protein FliG [Spirochaetales bacterium]|uniref:Flagellar motor switch protein FliG n=1 Tax=Candidatus Thalassospirochaeta sargassi TaxID=3119039 RepID=A0AAJ1MKX2_9SPIO|nr:flagellar motor switch protein FliG [Spirochaetales bacterium]
MKKIDRAAAAYQKSGFLKTSEKDKPVSKGYSKAAKFLLLVGPDQAAEVLKQFSPEDVEKIAREIAQVRKLGKEESSDILKEFGGVGAESRGEWKPPPGEAIDGGPERAKEMLYAALGPERGQAVFDKVLPFGGRKPFDFMNDLQQEQILFILKNEPAYVMSIVLSFLEADISSRIISGLPPESRKEIVLRIARQGEVAPGIIERMEGIFRDRIRAQGRVVTEEVDGKSVLAGILRHMSPVSEEKILDDLTEAGEGIADDIRNSIYTIDLLINMDNKDIQTLLRDFDNSELAIIIKGKSKEIRDRILDNISERRRIMIEEESVYLGAMRRSDVDKSTRELVEYMMELERRDEISIPRGDEEWI